MHKILRSHKEHSAAVGRNHSRIEQEETKKTEFLDNEWTNLTANSLFVRAVSSVTSCSRTNSNGRDGPLARTDVENLAHEERCFTHRAAIARIAAAL
jgi:hypothetical protein